MGIEVAQKAWKAYNTLGNLLRDLGVNEAEDKAVEPTTIIEFLGVQFDSIKMIISVAPARIHELQKMLVGWMAKQHMTKVQLENCPSYVTVFAQGEFSLPDCMRR